MQIDRQENVSKTIVCNGDIDITTAVISHAQTTHDGVGMVPQINGGVFTTVQRSLVLDAHVRKLKRSP